MIRELAIAPAPWYKAKLKETFLGIKSGTLVWFKLNTEKPLSSGASYWVFDPKDEIVRHIGEGLGNETLQGFHQGNQWQIADAEETIALNKRFKPLVNKIVNSPQWSMVGHQMPKGTKEFKLDYQRKYE